MSVNVSRDPVRIAAVVLSITAALLAAGCGGEASIPIQPAASGAADGAAAGLGPGVRPLSFGPGEKGFVDFHPSGERLAFVVNGYAAEKPLFAQSFERLTGEDFDARGAAWLDGDNLVFLGRKTAGDGAPEPGDADSLFLMSRETDGESMPRLVEIARGVDDVDSLREGGFVAAVAVREGPDGVRLVLFRDRIKSSPETVRGRVVGLSVSPNGSEAALAVSKGEDGVELLSQDLAGGSARRVALLSEGQGILGSPQWTESGIHYIAGGEGAPYVLYRATEGSEEPEQVQGVGEGFLPSGIEASPDGKKLAVVGRRNASSPTNLYILSLASGTLEAVTENEDMEIKTGPHDISWTPDGSGVVLIARIALPGPEVYDAPARSLAPAFYNLYLAPVPNTEPRPR